MSEESKSDMPDSIPEAVAQATGEEPNRCLAPYCQAPIPPNEGSRKRQFCKLCWALVPAHLQAAYKAEQEYSRATHESLRNPVFGMLVGCIGQRILQRRCERDQELRRRVQDDLDQHMKRAAQTRLEQIAAAAAEKAKGKVLVVPP